MLDCTCIGQLIDCAGVIGGTASLDNCDACTGGTTGLQPNPDTDGDGFLDCADICPLIFNADQLDFDGDGVGDLCDNCAWVSNSDQADSNGNGIGDSCEEVSIEEVNAGSALTGP